MATGFEWAKGRNLIEVTFTLTYADTTAALMGTLPANVSIVGYVLNVVTAFSGGTAQINVGTTTTATELLAACGVGSKGSGDPATACVLPGYATTAPTPIYAYAGASNTVGEVDVTLLLASNRHRIK